MKESGNIETVLSAKEHMELVPVKVLVLAVVSQLSHFVLVGGNSGAFAALGGYHEHKFELYLINAVLGTLGVLAFLSGNEFIAVVVGLAGFIEFSIQASEAVKVIVN